jgi:hypothetical protein
VASKSKGQSPLPSVDVVALINQSEEMQNTQLSEKKDSNRVERKAIVKVFT